MIGALATPAAAPLEGQLTYKVREYGFVFEVIPEALRDLQRLAGQSGTASLSIGTLTIEIGIETKKALYASGYHPHTAWTWGRLPPISALPGFITLDVPWELIPGVGYEIVEVGQRDTTYDPASGWVCVGDSEVHSADQIMEFSRSTVAVVRNGSLVSLWLQPTWE